jgi:hypothetical protein
MMTTYKAITKRIRWDQTLPEGRNQAILHTKAEKREFLMLADQLSKASDRIELRRINETLSGTTFGAKQ